MRRRAERALSPLWIAIAFGLVALQAAALWAMGQPLTCRCGSVTLWAGDIASAENSQQLTDWYSFSHLIHGFLFYLLLRLLAPRLGLAPRFLLAMTLEVGWEVLENTPFIIERYRQSALAAGYVGDSILNSVSDSVAAALGFLLAYRLPAWLVVALAIAMELFVGYRIRDNLTLNVIQLIYPSEALSRWQSGR